MSASAYADIKRPWRFGYFVSMLPTRVLLVADSLIKLFAPKVPSWTGISFLLGLINGADEQALPACSIREWSRALRTFGVLLRVNFGAGGCSADRSGG